ncbi:hypothetical protein ACS5PK_11100 [Roseateles sp. DB2]|uniref:hypothetical protein n=1 Tax=Roseateles sp. DB2 TaxID=3453717 RepID=UPI003EED15C4
MRPSIVSSLAPVLALLLCAAAQADGTKPVTSGPVVRGVNLGPRPATANPGDPTGRQCDFSKEPVSQAGRLEGASVNCGPGTTVPALVVNLAPHLTAYCVIDSAPVKSARLLQASRPGNATHCDLSGITPQDAKQQFGQAFWR